MERRSCWLPRKRRSSSERFRGPFNRRQDHQRQGARGHGKTANRSLTAKDKRMEQMTWRRGAVMVALAAGSSCARGATPSPAAEAVSEIAFVPLPKAPLGAQVDWQMLKEVTPDKVLLGRLLFFDPRLSADRTISCASCHRSANAFADRTPNSVGVHGRRGSRKRRGFRRPWARGRHGESERHRRLQDTDVARYLEARALHARWLDGHAAGGHRSLRRGRRSGDSAAGRKVLLAKAGYEACQLLVIEKSVKLNVAFAPFVDTISTPKQIWPSVELAGSQL